MIDETGSFRPGADGGEGDGAPRDWEAGSHRILDDFERRWLGGVRPGAESLLGDLAGAPVEWVERVLSQAIKIELERRHTDGERPGPGDFHGRLPGFPAVVDAVFAEVAVQGTSPGGRYGDREEYARGGQSVVYRAWDRKLNRVVALKKLRGDVAQRHPESRARFLAETEATARLDHPGIVPVYDRGEDFDGLPYYTMPFVRGRTFKEEVRNFRATAISGAREKSLAFSHLLRNVIDVAMAVHYLHAKGVVHRDLKPENIILNTHGRNNRGHNDPGQAVVLDLGLAKFSGKAVVDADDGESILAAPQSVADMSLTGQVKGTVRYMSPEQARGAGDGSDPRPDIYSLGGILYFLLTGKEPFEGITDLKEILVRLANNESPLGPERFGGGAPRPLEMICRKAMDVKPEKRYPSAAEFAKDLEAWLAYKPVTPFREWPHTRAWRWAKGHRASLSATAASAALVAATAAGIYGTVEHFRDVRRQDEIARQLEDAQRRGEGAFAQFNPNEMRAAEESAQHARRQVRSDDPAELRGRADDVVARLSGDLERARSSDARATEARALVDRMSTAEAEREALAALKDCPNNPLAHYVLGTVRHHQDRMDDAAREFREALRLRPNLPDAVAGLAHALAHQKKYTQAKEILAPLLDQATGATEAMIELARIHYVTDETGRAIDLARQAVKDSPGRIEPYGVLGLWLFQECMDDEAVSIFREAVRRSGEEPTVCHLLGYTLWESGALEEGLQFMKKAYRDSELFQGSLPPPESLEHFQAVIQARGTLLAGFAGAGPPPRIAGLVKMPNLRDRLAMAEACYREGEYAAAALLYQSVFGDRVNDLSATLLVQQVGDPYWFSIQLGLAMRAAARALGDDGRNRIACTDFDRTRARRQVFDRLTYSMKGLSPKALAKLSPTMVNPSLLIGMGRCLKGRDMAPVRDQALDQFPAEEFPAEERAQWLALWESIRQSFTILKAKG